MTSDTTEKEKETATDKLQEVTDKLEKFIKPISKFVTFALPLLIKYSNLFYKYWSKIPRDESYILIGLVFCFFGGLYPTLFAAIQAAKASGWDDMISALSILSNEVKVILEADKKDNEKDDDGDGVADVDQLNNKEFVMRKTKLVITKMNPKKVDSAIGTLYKVWLGVAAALAVKFARTISLALSLADALSRPVRLYGEPFLQKFIPYDYAKWIPVLTQWAIKSIAMSIAWYIQTVISALTSALQGGLMTARAILRIANKKGSNLFGLIPKDDKDTYIDETIGFALACLGFYFQFSIGFDIQFPFNLPLLPFEITEFWLKWYITSED